MDKLLKEMRQLNIDNNEWMKKHDEMTSETRKCEEILRVRSEKAKLMQLKSKKMEMNMTLVKNTARCVQVNIWKFFV